MVKAPFHIHKRLWQLCVGHRPISHIPQWPREYKTLSVPVSTKPTLSLHPTLRYQQLSTITIMSPPSVDSGPLSDVFKAKLTTLVRDQLKPIVAELAAQQETLLSHLALLRHNYNVNDYQMTRLENIRNLEQSIKCAFRYSSADRAINRAT
jgi:hypothetical protein